jgi:catechol 2,3-dioxygenase-like lactoylglutathione lyase family enzyme
MTQLDTLHHVAITVADSAQLKATADWYRSTFQVETGYQDETWALLKFANISLALVVPGQHPPHICVTREDGEKFGELKTHRDGTRTVYVSDPSGNVVEVLKP